MLTTERVQGVLSLGHVMEVAKHMPGGYQGMLIACGALF